MDFDDSASSLVLRRRTVKSSNSMELPKDFKRLIFKTITNKQLSKLMA
jgi:hypothetical protein